MQRNLLGKYGALASGETAVYSSRVQTLIFHARFMCRVLLFWCAYSIHKVVVAGRWLIHEKNCVKTTYSVKIDAFQWADFALP